MMRRGFKAILVGVLVLALTILTPPLLAQDSADRLTSGEVTEMAQALEALVIHGRDLAGVEDQGRQFLAFVIEDFGEDSREALQIELVILMALQMQTRHEKFLPLSRYSMERALRLLKADDPLVYRLASTYSLALLVEDEGEAALGLLAEAIGQGEGLLAPDELALQEMRIVQAIIAAKEGDVLLAEANYRRVDEILGDRTDEAAKSLRVTALQGWASLMADYASPDEAIPVLEAALEALDAQWKDAKNPHMMPMRLTTLQRLCEMMVRAGKRDEAAALLRPELAEAEAVFGRDSPQWADLAVVLAISLGKEGASAASLTEARDLFRQAVAVMEQVYAPDITALLDARVNYAAALVLTGDSAGALAQIRAMKGAARASDRAAITFVLYSAVEAGLLDKEAAVEAVLTLLQESQRSGAAAAQRLLAARLASGSGAAAERLRRKTDLSALLQGYQTELARVTALPAEERDAALTAELRSKLGETMRALEAAEADLARQFPELAEVTAQMALPLAEIRRRLGPNAALVVIDPPAYGDDVGLIVAVSQTDVDWHSFQVPGAEVEAAIRDLRASIDLRLGVRAATALEDGEADAAPAAFELDKAHWLYRQLSGQVEAVTRGKKLVYFDLRGAVSALPPQVLVASPPQSEDLSAADWLIRRHAVAILPAISALPDRRLAAPPPPERLLAFADPDFGSLTALAPAELRGSLSPLPETAAEVRDVALALGADRAGLYLGAAASEAAVKAAPLAGAGMLYFATHGLVSGDQVGEGALAEPALALTPGAGEDGFLTASEIAELKLDAGLVVLSACNTAAGDAPGADSLSGLAQSFLYAGARGLMVSHWPVESRSAVALMTDLFRLRADNPQASLAEAQQQAILRMIAEPANERWSHPAFWAPFVVIGSPE